ncbi:MAG: hypothetical protein M3326_05280 [Actinomycetota bacterium]|nr:hypothetical protein [Actinomycetota bacterium]
MPDIPATTNPLLQLLTFPYAAGPDVVRALVERGGNAAVDEAFRTRPTTSEQVLHPDRFLQARLGLRVVLGETLAPGTAARAADGWDGDHYVTWSARGMTCVRVNVRMDTPGDTSEVREGFRRWAAGHPGTDIKLDGVLTVVTRCA